jgi:hypothetical protein
MSITENKSAIISFEELTNSNDFEFVNKIIYGDAIEVNGYQKAEILIVKQN